MWYFHKRYVIIDIEGIKPEWMLNALLREGIAPHDTAFLSRTSMRLRLSARDFRKLHALSHAFPFRVRIVSRRGLPFFIHRLRSRAVLVFGGAALLFLFAFLAPRILMISVSGCYRVPEAAVLRLLAAEGVKPFALRDSVDVIPVADRVRAADARLAWVGLDLDGVRCRVEVVEAVPMGAKVDYSVPCDIVAKKAGVVLSVLALYGESAVKVGQRVSAGDVLVKGQVTDEGAEDPVFVHARGTVQANVFYRAKAVAPQTVTALNDTGRSAFFRLVRIGSLTITKTKVPFEQAEQRMTKIFPAVGTLLPLTAAEGRSYEQKQTQRPLSNEEREEEAALAAARLCFEKIPKNAAVVSKTTQIIEQDGVTVAECTVVTKESIGITKEISH